MAIDSLLPLFVHFRPVAVELLLNRFLVYISAICALLRKLPRWICVLSCALVGFSSEFKLNLAVQFVLGVI